MSLQGKSLKVNVGTPDDWCTIEVLDPGELRLVTSPLRRIQGNDEILIAFAADGSPCAISAICPHRKFPLAEFARRGQTSGSIVCSAHQYEFEVTTGSCINGAGSDASAQRLKTWPLVLESDGSYAVEIDPENSQ